MKKEGKKAMVNVFKPKEGEFKLAAQGGYQGLQEAHQENVSIE
jgi:hypothetical protein